MKVLFVTLKDKGSPYNIMKKILCFKQLLLMYKQPKNKQTNKQIKKNT